MTDRVRGYIVTLDADIREDDAQATITALHQIRGVVSVEPVVADIDSHMATERVRREFMRKIMEVLS